MRSHTVLEAVLLVWVVTVSDYVQCDLSLRGVRDRGRATLQNITSSARLQCNSGDTAGFNRKAQGRVILPFITPFNYACRSSRRPEDIGVCFSLPECRRQRGTAGGTCAGGYGVCCLLDVTCNGMTYRNGTRFRSPGFPRPYNEKRLCHAAVHKARADICQIRLDFIAFEIDAPTNGTCSGGHLIMTGQNRNNIIPILCGNLTGQHVYVDVSAARGPVVLSISTAGRKASLFDIKMTQLSCRDMHKAPSGCLQYHTGIEGVFSSFNYGTPSQTASGGAYLNNLDYTICFRKEMGCCSLTYRTLQGDGSDNATSSFSVQGRWEDMTEEDTSGAGYIDCPHDYLYLSGVPYCGNRLNPDEFGTSLEDEEIVDDTSGPFMARFVTDDEVTSRGFQLVYRQNLCTTKA